jgi:phosphoribosyl-AMP cyclohydrolase
MIFPPRTTLFEIEEGDELRPKFDERGIIPCVTQDATSHEVLMVGYMNAEALVRTIENRICSLLLALPTNAQVLGSVGGPS